jgi:hypothetical protein
MDLALIKVEVTPEYVFSVADWVMPNVGDIVFAIGSPAGLENTVTQGIVSALGRRFLQLGDVFQIDAAVNQGNSGGPIIDMTGRLVGVVFAGIASLQGLNFAIPAERLVMALPAMIAGGKADRPWLGLSLSESVHGVEIIYVAPTTPAAEQRIREGSIIRAINGQDIQAGRTRIPDLQDMLFPLKPGELVSLDLVDANGDEYSRVLRLAARPEYPLLDAARIDTRERIVTPLFGIVLSPAAGSSFFPTFQIRRVIRGLPAFEAGFSQNDPVSIRALRIMENDGFALLEISVRQRRMGYLETTMTLAALLDSSDTL